MTNIENIKKCPNCEYDLEQVFRQEKEKSYEQGKYDGGEICYKKLKDEAFEQYALGQHKGIEYGRQSAINEGLGDKLVANWKEVEEKGRHSAYREIMEIVEGMFIYKKAYKNTSNISIKRGAYNKAVSDLLSILEEKLTQK